MPTQWARVWSAVAAELSESWSMGLGRLVTEDVLRFAVVKALVAQGVHPDRLESEWRRSGVPDAVDLVVTTSPQAAIEFKYPREPRETSAAWTQHLGEVLRDFYRLAYMPADFQERWCVQLLSPRVRNYFSGVADRYDVHLAWRPGQTITLEPRARRSSATGWDSTHHALIGASSGSHRVRLPRGCARHAPEREDYP